MRADNDSPPSNLKYLILKQKLLYITVVMAGKWKHRTCGINISNK